MSLEKEEADILKKKRSVFRRNTTKLVNKVLDLRNADGENDTILLKSFSEQLKAQGDELKELDNSILGYVLENEDEDACDKEVEESGEYSGKITHALVFINEELGVDDDAFSVKSGSSRRMQRSASKESVASECSQYSNQRDTGKRKVRVKLPQLEIKKFSGKIQEFQEFWDSFVSAIHENDELANVDKMKYLKGYLEEPARSVISGVPITDSNYQTAIALLKKRFAKPSMLEHAHINQMVNMQPVFNEDDVIRLRKFRDQIEANFRGLEALSVDQGTYSKIVVPVLVEKLPKQLKFSMVRSRRKSVLEWSLDELIAELDLELEVRENHAEFVKISGRPNKQEEAPRQLTRWKGPNTASALFTPEGKQKCVYCTGDHKPNECTNHTDPEDRKSILKKYFRCFICLKANHRSFECRSKLRCPQCKAKHHVSICSSMPLKPENKDAPANKLSANAPAWVGSMCSGDSVALQTALAKVNDKKGCNVRVLFDSGSHRSFISAKAVENLGLRPVRRENLSIKAFGCRETDDSMRDVVEFCLLPLMGEKRVKVSCYVVDNITSIANIHVEKVKKLYPHLHMIYFSDVSRFEDKLNIQILIGSDFQWEFMEGEEIRGGPHEPVAVKTTLGWVLSGPLKGEKFDSSPQCSVNLLPCEPSAKGIEEQVNKLWDLDSLGIRPKDNVHEALLDDIVFTGERYSVSLPWKEGHGPLPLNYNNCVARLKSQIRKLKQDPKILHEYDRIISEQLQTGIISKVSKMEDAERVSYLPHSAVVRENAETTKVRVVYDASCKDKNTGTSLNDCLHVGPSLTPLIFDILLRFRDARVAPLKDLTIPRLELMSARILAVLMDNVYKALCSQVIIDKVKYWLDSKTALYWIYNQGEWKQWVQFRVSEILRLTKKSDWRHVGGKDNPADLGSRGVSALVLKDSKLWWEGPKWLRESENNWPTSLVLEDSTEIKEERKRMPIVLSVVTEKVRTLSNVVNVERFNSLTKLLRVTAWVKRFVNNLKHKKEKRKLEKGNLAVEEIIGAERIWIQDAQKMLEESANFEKTRVHLGVIEKNGLLVCQGRLENSDLDIESKYPIILPKEHKLAQLIVLDCHEKVHHLKVRATLAELRSRFWITSGRQFVKKILKPCFRCRYLDGKSFNAPATAALPDFRVSEAPPFSTTGVDFAGPLFVKAEGGEMIKSYICLFSCFITRAVHLEVVSDLATPTFVNCLRRFCARRGTPVRIVSDNAKTFKATSKLLNKLLSETEVRDFFVSKRIIWRFNLDRSPWWGGAFERMVGSVKRCLRKVLGNARLTQDELTTVLVEVEATLNSRPLTYQHEEFDSRVLTPSHLLVGRRISPLSNYVSDDLDFEDDNNISLSKRFFYLTKKLSHFWKRWHTEYLSGLREAHKLKQAKSNAICKGDIVIVQDESNVKRNTWKIAIVEELVKGKDGETRGAKVRKASRKGKPEILNRPLQKLYPLEIHCSNVCKEGKDGGKSMEEMLKVNDMDEVKNANENTAKVRPRRAAAQDARWKSQLMLDP